jgi:UDP-glucose:(heptosyl)LPS alpha-1,3-glucosyltransferase
MNLALIRRRFSATGGAELYLQRLLVALSERGHTLHLLTQDWEQAPPGVSVHPLHIYGSRAVRPIRFADAVEAELSHLRVDCIFSLERTRRQDVYRAGDGVHRVWLQRRRQFAPRWARPFIGLGRFHRNLLHLESQVFDPRNTRHVIANSAMVKQEIIEQFAFPAERIHLVPNGVDVVRFQSGERFKTRAQFGIQDDELLLLFVGSGWERKGLKFLLRAMQALKKEACPLGVGPEGEGPAAPLEITNSLDRPGASHGSTGHAAGLRTPLWRCRTDKIKLLIAGKGKRPRSVPDNVIFAGSMERIENAYAAADLIVFLPL